MYSALILLYAATAAVAGYVAASYYRQMQGKLWVRNILLTCVIFAGPLFVTFCFNNTLAIVYEVRVCHTGATLWLAGTAVLTCCVPINRRRRRCHGRPLSF